LKTVRLRKLLIEYLSVKPRSTQEILDYINGRTKHGTTSHVLGNVLAKDKRFKKVGTTTKASARGDGNIYHNYSITIWDLNSN